MKDITSSLARALPGSPPRDERYVTSHYGACPAEPGNPPPVSRTATAAGVPAPRDSCPARPDGRSRAAAAGPPPRSPLVRPVPRPSVAPVPAAARPSVAGLGWLPGSRRSRRDRPVPAPHQTILLLNARPAHSARPGPRPPRCASQEWRRGRVGHTGTARGRDRAPGTRPECRNQPGCRNQPRRRSPPRVPLASRGAVTSRAGAGNVGRPVGPTPGLPRPWSCGRRVGRHRV